MFKKVVIASASALFALAPFAAQAEVTVYGRVTAGITNIDKKDELSEDGATLTENKANWNWGSTSFDGGGGPSGSGTRIGFKSSAELDNGMQAGIHIERAFKGGDVTKGRHQNLWISGGFGKITLGQQGNPYMKARHWDQTYFFGGWYGYGSEYRAEGVGYSNNFGALGLDILATANEDDGEAVAAADENAAIDQMIIRVGYDLGAVKINYATQSNNTKSATARNNTAFGFNGSVGPLDWYVASQTSELANPPAGGATGSEQSVSSLGFFLGYKVNDKNTVYLYNVTHDEDFETTFRETMGGMEIAKKRAKAEQVIGYARQMGSGVSFHFERRTADEDRGAPGEESEMFIGLRMTF